MTAVRLRHLTLRIARRGGWSWGDPQAWMDAATQALPKLLAAELGDLFAGTGVRAVRGHWCVRVKLSPKDVGEIVRRAAVHGSAAKRGRASAVGLARVRSAIRGALARGLAELPPERIEIDTSSATSVRTATPGRTEDPPESGCADEDAISPNERWVATIVGVLRRWRANGSLLPALAAAPAPALARWHDAILSPSDGAPELDDPEFIALLRAARAVALGLSSEEALPLLARRIAVALQVAEQAGLAITDPRVRASIDGVLSTSGRAPLDVDGIATPAKTVGMSGPRATPTPQSSPASPRADTMRETEIDTVLPFLALGVLDRLGWLSRMQSELETIDEGRSAGAFATAFAYKFAAPPKRGWMRDARDHALAAAFGLARPAADAKLVDLGEALVPRMQPLDDHVREVLARGRTRSDACCLIAATYGERDGLLAAELVGGFPIAWSRDAAGVVERLPGSHGAPVLVPGPAVEPATFAALDRAGLRFVTDVPPTRRERWHRLAVAGTRLWSNDTERDPAEFAQWFRRLAASEAAARAEQGWRGVAERTAVVRATNHAFDLGLTLAIGVALATLAWELWREREPTDAGLAYTRFGDLSGRIRVTADAVEIGLPRGRRRDDLLAHGLLRPIDGIPWLPRSRVEFALA